MVSRISIVTERKGSNPGGKCVYSDRETSFAGYLKYCDLSNMGRESALSATRQPIYEALTLVIAKKLGLHVPEFYIVPNNGHAVAFDFRPNLKSTIRKDKPFYFLSKIVDITQHQDPEKTRKILASEKIYRDLLLVTDVSHKQQNFTLMPDENGGRIVYIDAGCSFVDAVEGKMFYRRGKKINGSKSDLKQGMQVASRYALLTADEESILVLEDILNLVDTARIPRLNPRGYVNIADLLTNAERSEIKRILLLNLAPTIRRHKDSGNLIRL